MTFVLIGKDLVLEGPRLKIEDIQFLGRYIWYTKSTNIDKDSCFF